ncbi:hypothetical protein JCM11641_006049 [Rhodosporidiobolus odoratus]
MSSPSAYKPLPQSPIDTAPSSPTSPSSSPNEKLPLLARSDSDGIPLKQEHQEPAQATRKAALKAGVVTLAVLVLALGGLAGAGLYCKPETAERAFTRAKELCGYSGVGQYAEEADGLAEHGREGSWRWWVKRAGGEEFSTSTLKDGSTMTFVRTTRPIVNPGGYTIGTLTGFVPVSTTAEAAATSAPTSPSSSPATESPIAASGADGGGELNVSASSSAASSAADYSSLPSSTVPAHTVTETAVSTTTVGTTQIVTVTETVTSAPSSSPVLYKRAAPSSEVEEEAEGKEEYSTSTDRKGRSYTLVKTTRPIVNGGGYTIGTLDGAWVDVAKQTATVSSIPESEPTSSLSSSVLSSASTSNSLPPSSAAISASLPATASASASASSNEDLAAKVQRKRAQHEELRKREEDQE